MKIESPVRAYRQTARADAAEENGRRIIEAFQRQLTEGWFEEIRLEDVAAEAGVSVQTVIRRFGGKEGLLETVNAKVDREVFNDRNLPVGEVGQALDAVIDEYDRLGDFMMRMLAQEDRYRPVRQLTDHGRKVHRQWVGELFAPWLERLSGSVRRDVHDRLVIALDLYVWKLVRRDMKRSKAALRQTMLALCAEALGTTPEMLESSHGPEKSDA